MYFMSKLRKLSFLQKLDKDEVDNDQTENDLRKTIATILNVPDSHVFIKKSPVRLCGENCIEHDCSHV